MNKKAQDRLFLSVVLAIAVAGYIAYWLPSRVGGSRWKLGRTIHEARQMLSGMETYRKDFGDYPLGDSAAIMNALTGDNPTHKLIMPPPSGSTNQAGVWLDPWGTAYEISVPPPVVKSAGPDKKFGDADDIIINWNKLASSNKLP